MTQQTPGAPGTTIRRRSIVIPSAPVAPAAEPAPSAQFLPPGVAREPIAVAASEPTTAVAAGGVAGLVVVPGAPATAPAGAPGRVQSEGTQAVPAAPAQAPLAARVQAEASSIDPPQNGKGNRFGPNGLPQEMRDKIAELHGAGKTIREISAAVGIGRLTVSRYLPGNTKTRARGQAREQQAAKAAQAAQAAQAAPAAPATAKPKPKAQRRPHRRVRSTAPVTAQAAAKAAQAPKAAQATSKDAQLAQLFAELLVAKKVDAETALRVVPAVELIRALVG